MNQPSRRAASQAAVVLPSLRRPVPAVPIVVDTSGSMSEADLAEAMAEVAGVLRGEMIDRGEAIEAVLTAGDLRRASKIWAGNSLRGLVAAKLV